MKRSPHSSRISLNERLRQRHHRLGAASAFCELNVVRSGMRRTELARAFRVRILEPVDRLVIITDNRKVRILAQKVELGAVPILVLVDKNMRVSVSFRRLRVLPKIRQRQRNHLADQHPLMPTKRGQQCTLERLL